MTELKNDKKIDSEGIGTEEKGKRYKKLWHWCCGVPVLICMLAFAALIISVFIIEKKQASRMSNRNKPEAYSEIFNNNIVPDYTISGTDEEKFNQKMIELLQKDGSEIGNFTESGDAESLSLLDIDEKIKSAKSDMKFLKEYYPEGYYLVVRSVLETPENKQQFPNFYHRSISEESRIDYVVHELSHLSIIVNKIKCGDFGYLIEDKFVDFKKLENTPKGDELLKYIDDRTSLDNEYLGEIKQDIYTTFDEVVAYTKSVRVARSLAYKNKTMADEDSTQALSRQLYYLSLHLKNMKENHPDFWESFKREKGFPYIISRQVAIVKTEIQAAKDEGVWSSTDTDFTGSIDNNLSSLDQNQALFDEIYISAGLDAESDLENLSKKEIIDLGLIIQKF